MQFGWWAHPIFSKTGDYPAIMQSRIENISIHENYKYSRLPTLKREEIDLIRNTHDFLGLNHYTTSLVKDYEYPIDYPTSHSKDVGVAVESDPSWKNSSASWLKVVPWGFRKLLKWIKNEYDNPLVYVTENGYADNGQLNDVDRIYYHKVCSIYNLAHFTKTERILTSIYYSIYFIGNTNMFFYNLHF